MTWQAGKWDNENILSWDKLDQHRFLSQNFDSTNSEVYVVYATSIVAQAALTHAHISWVEFE